MKKFILLLATLLSTAVSANELPVLTAKEAKLALLEVLKDPESTKFKGLYIPVMKFIDGQEMKLSNSICGFVNTKNSYGGYTGWELFLVTKSATDDSIETSDNDLLTEGICDNEYVIDKIKISI